MAQYYIHIPRLYLSRILSCLQRPRFKTLHISAFSVLAAPDQTKPTNRRAFSHIFQQCSDRVALNPGKQAHALMIVSGFNPTIYVTNCLIKMYLKCGKLEYASKVFDEMPHWDVISWNTMISGYARFGDMGNAQLIFDSMPERDVISWNSLISGYLQNGDYWKSIDAFARMGEMGSGAYDCATFAVILKACSVLEEYDVGIQVHGIAVQTGFDNDVVTGSALVDMYAKCKKLDYSLQLFYGMPEKNWVSWGAIIAGCVQNDQLIKGFELFKEMQKEGTRVSQSSYASVFRSCARLSNYSFGTQLHGLALKTDFGLDSIVATAILDMYAKCDSMPDARKLFNSLPNRTLQSYNAIIVGYARSDEGFEALKLFQLLQRSGLAFDEISLSAVISACTAFKGHLEALQVHGLTIKSSFRSNIYVTNTILDMYAKCGALAEACRVFDEMGRRDAVSWNAIIAAHGQNGDEGTLSLFISMLRSRMEPDVFTYGSVLKACAGQHALNFGMQVHSRIIKSGLGFDSFIRNTLVDMYCKCGMMEQAEKIHDRTEEQMIVSWNAIISGFSLQKRSEDAQKFFCRMLEMGAKPDNFTYSTVLDTCANLATIGLAKQIHAQIIKQEMQSDIYISSTLVDMYSKCGDMQDSRLMFDKACKRAFVTWNVMICGYAQHGFGEEALELFENMQTENVKPNHATFISVLRACGHAGLIEKGLHYFRTMRSDYGLEPQLEHYACMVDIIGRSGQVSEALKLINEMPFEADDVIWRTLLSSCKIHRNVEVAEKAAHSLLQLDPRDSSAYVLLSNIYANAGMWSEVSKTRKMMRYNHLRKEPGCSWIEVKDEVHRFLVWDKTHPCRKETYEKLHLLMGETKRAGYEPGAEFLLDEEAEENEQQESRTSIYMYNNSM